ncbi:MAG TPA: thiamine pyrophosphate-dependent dehydrogenase E1 component subunit alpha [Brevefilum fermentans]|jgi:2-oxoisovalerate dehydrogenase E1 component alpha subunit|uniref:2-oxoisovalerate dehydrogenase subunit alpha n=1 Tax=Candidatus Brevifilum fermentans TaxID=1986204 RepID=A0A1Y6K5K5_9CHLR|nr:thiamine pyrophosphate-dependent dehydrogenase E1 component subunit alpha [Brevefilum fermentans]MDI9565876.1 thiamine pyrophosphate-dependent dehydrogenase E1 component subunit alpha [Chloroflexota bacterium]OQB87015.1 MAG: 2-oxoisovalerate dehydrogenase subunit alpha [Chloroflexi bacterium ADurb.Bin120]SMX53300.1 2-oxoisovalerate dehydrogenase subunit alpha [Brevefilum fermentans]HOM66847.1 thiamine pyrophosphate-dependent dehydrogenase E1 component subunit alpha [Brevefilum fermentans]HP
MTLSKEQKIDMFWYLLLSRRLDERAWVLHRQGKIAFHISGIGQEAAQIGAVYAIKKGKDWLVPYYRDLAMVLAMGMTPAEFVRSLMGKTDEPTSGARQMPSHFSMRKANILSHSAPVATQSPHAAGIGLAIKLDGGDAVVLTTIGEGSTSQGEWYEAVNFAAIHNLPVIFLVENNHYAISVPQEKQMAVSSAADKACGLGLPGIEVDGTQMFEVYDAVAEAVKNARAGRGPSVIEAKMYRLTPHSSDDDDRSYRTREEVEAFKKKDPLLMMKNLYIEQGLITEEEYEELEEKAKQMVDAAVEEATRAPYPQGKDAATLVYAEEVNNG